MKRFLTLMCAGLLLLTSSGCANKTPDNTTKKETEKPAYKILITSAYDALEGGFEIKKKQRIKFLIIRPDNTIVQNFNTVHEKIMHLVITKVDLDTFEHIHPEFDPNLGEFSFETSFDEPGAYRMFADFSPAGEERSIVINQDLMVGGVGAGTYKQLQIDMTPITSTDEYIFRFDIPGKIKNNEEFSYRIDITDKNGNRITPEPYLGALGHSIMLKESSLEYIHTHASPNDLLFTANVSYPGKYAVFTQVQINGKVYTIKKVISVTQNSRSKKSSMPNTRH